MTVPLAKKVKYAVLAAVPVALVIGAVLKAKKAAHIFARRDVLELLPLIISVVDTPTLPARPLHIHVALADNMPLA